MESTYDLNFENFELSNWEFAQSVASSIGELVVTIFKRADNSSKQTDNNGSNLVSKHGTNKDNRKENNSIKQ